MNRAWSKIKLKIGQEQYSFVKDTERRNAKFMIRMLSERAIQMQDVHLCFIDYTKAFDKVKHKDLFELLGKLDIFQKGVI